MKSIKRSVAVFLAVLVAFSSFAMLANAQAIYNWELDTQFYRMQRNADGYIVDADGNVIADENDVLTAGAEPVWVPAEGRAAKGEAVKARVFMTTDFAFATSTFFFFYPTSFLTHDLDSYEPSGSDYVLITNDDITTKVGANKYGGIFGSGTEVEGMFDEMVWEGYLEESDIDGKGWVMVNLDEGLKAIQLDGSEWLFEFNFIVNENASDAGQFYLSTECIADYDNWMAATVIAAQPSGEGGAFSGRTIEASSDVDTGTFGYTLNDTDTDSSLQYTTATLTFDANGGTFAGGKTEISETADIQPMKAATLPEAPTAPGGIFLGWVKADVENPTEDDILDPSEIKYGYYDVAYKAFYQSASASYIQNVYTMDVNGNYPETPVTTNPGASTGDVVNAASYTVSEGFALDTDMSTQGDVEVTADGTAVLDIYVKRNQYEISFEEAHVVINPYYEAEYEAPIAPEKAGMNFTGWLGSDGTVLQAGEKATVGLAGVSYTAQYESAVTTVAIKAKYVDPFKPSSTATQIIDVATVDTIVGYTVAISETEEGTDDANKVTYYPVSKLPAIRHFEYDAENTTTVTAAEDGSTVLYVAYKTVNYTVEFAGAETFTQPYGSLFTVPAVPEVAGKIGTGWETEDGNIFQTAGTELGINGDYKFVPVYEDIIYNTTLSFAGEEGVDYPEDAAVPSVAGGKMGDEIVLADPAPVTGWTFDGWVVEGAVEQDGKYYYGTADVTVVGSWIHDEYTITFWLDSAKTIYYDSYTYYYGDVVEFPDAPPADLMPAGKAFVEWDSDIITMPAENIDVIAASENIIYTVTITFDTHGEEAFDPITFDAEYGDIITSDDLADYEELEGYDFNGWKINGKAMTAPFSYKVVGKTGIVGDFSIHTWDLYFWANEDDAEPIVMIPDVKYGSAIHTYTPVAPTKEGNVFKFWDMEPTTMEDEDMHFTAVWKTEEYTVIWDNDGATVENKYKYGESLVIPEVSKEGYTFKGWAGLADGTTTMPDVGEDGATVTYTAVWEANTYDAVFYVDGEVYVTVPTAYGADIVPPAAPEKAGYDFGGWDPAVGKMDSVDGKEFNATWNVKGDIPYTVTIYTMDTTGAYVTEVLNFTAATDSIVSYTPEIKNGFTLNDAENVLSGTVAADGSTNLVVKYIRNKYTFKTFVDGAETSSATYYYEAAVAAPATPVKEGHTFSGWDAEIPAKMPANDVTLSGSFSINAYNVIYVVDGEVYETVENVEFGTNVTAIAAPTKEGYTFSGWDKTAFVMPDEDVTVTGTFAVNTHNVIYVVDGEVYETVENVAFGTNVTAIAAPVKEGYTFSGWDKTAFVMPDEDVTVTGTFAVNTNDVIYMVDGEVYETITNVAFGTEVTAIAAPTKEGYTFSGWDKTAFTMPNEDVVVSGTFTVNTHDVIYVVDGEVYETIADVAYGTEVTVLAPLTKEGYTFSGWDKADFTMPDEDVTISGSWTVNTYDVIYMVDGVEYTRVEDVAYGTPVTVLDDLVEAGKTFSGWDKSDFTMPAEDVVINGSWTTNNYTVTFYTNKDKTDVYFTYTGALGAQYNVPSIANEGYEFLGWFNADGTEANLPAAGEITTIPLNGAEYYADWNVIEYELVYNAGAGKFGDGKNTATYMTAYGTAQADWQKPADPERAGYTFGGWNINENDTMPANKKVVTAIWDAIGYTVTWIDGDAEIVENYIYGEEILAPEMEKEGYTFMGWLEADGETYFSEGDVMGEKSLVYTAQWEGNDGIEYTVYKYFEKIDKTGWSDAETEVFTGKAGETAYASADAVEGFYIDGENSELSAVIKGDGSTALVIYYYRNTVKVTVKDPTGATYLDGSFTFGETIELAAPEKEGFTFVEWQDANGNVVSFPMTAPAEDIAITPVWVANKYTITFLDDNGDVIEAAKEVDFGSAIVAPADPEKDGYNFAYWVDQESGSIMPATMPAKNVTYVAYYTAGESTTYYINVYTMDVNGKYTMTAQTIATGTTGERIAVTPGTLSGYTYDATLSVLNGIITADGKAALEIYYARDLYTVTYNSGDGVFADGKTVAEYKDIYYGAAVPVPAEPTREGYEFAGWDAEIPVGMPAENLTFNATWAEAEYTITYIVNDNKTVETYKFGETVTAPETPNIAGMTFTGWDTEIPATMPAKDMIIIAKFEISVYEVKYMVDGVVFQQYAVAHGDEIPVPAKNPTKEFYNFIGWTDIPETMPAQDIEINAIFERVDVKLIPMAGSTTIIDVVDGDKNVIYGLDLYMTEEILRESYLDVEGDGYFTVTPSKKTMCGTGTVIELYDNATGELKATYTIVIFGDLNGDANITQNDSSIATAEVDWFTSWSDPTSDDYNVYKTMAADFDKDGMIGRNEAEAINREVLGAVVIDQTSGNVIALV